MKNIIAYFFLVLMFSCSVESKKQSNIDALEINEQIYLNLGGEKQYIEILSSSEQNPVLLFIHGGPAWPQTPQLRYLNSEIANKYTLVIWEQRGAGKSYKMNPNPTNLTLKQIVNDGNELANWLKKKYKQDKIYLAGYSWGSLVGVIMASEHPENYKAYIGISQFINKDEGMKISRNWLRKLAIENNDQLTQSRIDSLENLEYYEDEHDRFFHQYLLVNEFGGAVYNKASLAELEKAENMYEDYKDYDWYKVWAVSSKVLQNDLYVADVRNITHLDVPVFLFEGRHDWNVPAVLAESWLNKLQAPKKKIIWFENSGHGPLEEEPKIFNKAVISVIEEIN
jgi:pimeloyl-ACP methyl ester carboxylesterase